MNVRPREQLSNNRRWNVEQRAELEPDRDTELKLATEDASTKVLVDGVNLAVEA